MADGVTFQTTTLASPPNATEVATDDAGAAGHVQIIKLAVSADGSATLLPADGTVGLGVDIKQSVALALDATTLAALESITVGSSVLPTGASSSAKQDTAQTALDAIKTAVETLDNAVGGSELQIDVVGSLPAGTAAIGKLAANSGVDIGDVDVLSIASGSNVVGRVGHDTTGFGSGRKVVTTAGTRVTLASTTAAKWVTITAETDNTGLVVVGSAAGVIASLSTREGTPLYAGDSQTLLVDDLAEVGLDSTVSGDGATFSYGT